MKKLLFINGTMGVGKSTLCRALLKKLDKCVYLDGDWCWNMHPWVVNEENKAMVLDNIAYLLNAYLRNSGYEYILFCWVMHQEEIVQDILKRLQAAPYTLHRFTLTCRPEVLQARIKGDVQSGERSPAVLERSLERMKEYGQMHTQFIDTSGLSPEQTAQIICRKVWEGC